MQYNLTYILAEQQAHTKARVHPLQQKQFCSVG